ncbi:MAG: ABC transporter substrate-binding protein [Desulfobulbaceae bacterium]|nr:ABC transporter substrate-binding protein [Desulfobulbaceae bacterium]
MLFKLSVNNISLPIRITVLVLTWLVLISWLHYRLNVYEGHRKVVQMGYMPVITNLAAPLLDHASRNGEGIRYKSLKFSSFAEMAEALRNDHIQMAFIIAPLSIVLRQQGTDIKIIYVGNRHESTMVARKDLRATTLAGLSGKTIAVPMRYSGHNLALRQMLAQEGLTNSVNIVEMNPPDMASAMTTGALDAYFVGEPFAAQTIKSGDSALLFHVEDFWPDFICNLVITKQSLIENEPETVKAVVEGAARSGIWARNNLDEAAEIASQYWNQPVDLIKYAMSNPPDRIIVDKFTPRPEEMQKLADLMVEFGLSSNNEIDGLIDDRFAKGADTTNITDLASILRE